MEKLGLIVSLIIGFSMFVLSRTKQYMEISHNILFIVLLLFVIATLGYWMGKGYSSLFGKKEKPKSSKPKNNKRDDFIIPQSEINAWGNK